MLSINTNISSIVAQRSMTTSTTKLNQAIERLSTGSKINHAADNAANYSIAKNMSTQLSACDVAADNIAMGMDLLSVAQDTIAGMQDRGSRIHALITQARNGTYGTDSLNAMTQEAQALVSEINRLYANTEYNGIKLFDNVELPEWAQEVKATAGTIDGKSLEQCAAEHNGFIAEVEEETPDVTVTDPTQLASAISSNTKIGIGNAQTLAKLAELVNDGTATCSGKTIILTNDIDLSAYHEDGGWTPIGTESNSFQGTFNGNGHKVTGLYINRPTANYQGLFGYAAGEIKNVGIENVNITANSFTGGLAGVIGGKVTNCYATGDVTSIYRAGLLAGVSSSNVQNSYAIGNITGENDTGGLVGQSGNSVMNCFTAVNVKGTSSTGGIVGKADSEGSIYGIINCYATGNVTGSDYTGGLLGFSYYYNVESCCTTGNVTGSDYTGGLIGQARYSRLGSVTDSYSTGNILGTDHVGGIIGDVPNVGRGLTFSNCYIIGNAGGTEENIRYIGGEVSVDMTNCEVFRYQTTSLQVGIHSDEDSKINVDTNLGVNLAILDLTSDSAYKSITNFLNKLSEKSTELGAAQNRLESAHESNMVQMDNLTSSLSTIRDADISEVSSDFIRQQILQQACATLMSTANQSPSIALQLL